MRSIEKLFDEVSASLQFPYYFGENWAAFDECIADLSWLPADDYLICITAAEETLVDDPEAFQTFIRVMQNVAIGWSEGTADMVVAGRSRAPFYVLMQVSGGSESLVAHRIAELGGTVKIV